VSLRYGTVLVCPPCATNSVMLRFRSISLHAMAAPSPPTCLHATLQPVAMQSQNNTHNQRNTRTAPFLSVLPELPHAPLPPPIRGSTPLVVGYNGAQESDGCTRKCVSVRWMLPVREYHAMPCHAFHCIALYCHAKCQVPCKLPCHAFRCVALLVDYPCLILSVWISVCH
jgi:hypothetical protein